MRTISGSCHCGNMRYHYTAPGLEGNIPARACGCNFCEKHGGVYTSNPAGKLNVHIDDDSLVNRYTFGTASAEFYICRTCGAVPVVTSTIDGREYAIINLNTADNLPRDDFDIAAADFESEDLEQRLARRSRNWIADVVWS